MRTSRRGPLHSGEGGARVTLAIWSTYIACLIIASYVAPLSHRAFTPFPNDGLRPPTTAHWFGTDELGRDTFARVVRGARLDLALALIGTAVSAVLGVLLGLIASSKGRASAVVMRPLDMFQAFPLIILAIILVSIGGNHLGNVVIAIAIISIPQFIRLVRSEALAVRESRFVEAARAMGASTRRIMLGHVLPNIAPTVVAQTALTAAQSILVIAAMSFLGVGIRPPTASWGAMIQSGVQDVDAGVVWPALFPGIAIFTVVWAFHHMGESAERLIVRGHGR